MKFPNLIYVRGSARSPLYEGSNTWNDFEDDETVAVYRLEKVCRVVHELSASLVEEDAGGGVTGQVVAGPLKHGSERYKL